MHINIFKWRSGGHIPKAQRERGTAAACGGRLLTLALVLAVSMMGTDRVYATVYCGHPYIQLSLNRSFPYNAVGYLNNGCTAFMIDESHIVAAAHCFDNSETGDWQSDLRFYPNFHPDRVQSNQSFVPRATVLRAVVGTRGGESVLGSGADWGIAKVGDWQATNGMPLPVLALANTIPSNGTPVELPGFIRHHFPYNDQSGASWDNMTWSCNQWHLEMHDVPIIDGTNEDNSDCNTRWAAGMLDNQCEIIEKPGHTILHNCNDAGGTSGAPLLYRNSKGNWYVLGVQHGGGVRNFSNTATPVCSQDVSSTPSNVAASVARFKDAPRYATNIAVHRRAGTTRATGVYAVDSDLGKVVYRRRLGAAPSYDGSFSFWSSLGRPYEGCLLTKIAALSADLAMRPQVFVVVDNNKIYTRYYRASGSWNNWAEIAKPPSTTLIFDIGEVYDVNGRSSLLAVTDKGAYIMPQKSDNVWDDWEIISKGSYRKITGLLVDGVIQVALIDYAGKIWRTLANTGGWDAPVAISQSSQVSSWTDIDMTYDEHGRGFMLAVSTYQSGNRLYFQPMYGSNKWTWRYFTTHLWAPSASSDRPAPQMTSITAGTWQEDPSGVNTPVIFATGIKGNVYFVEYTRTGTPRWVLDWKLFHHEKIMY